MWAFPESQKRSGIIATWPDITFWYLRTRSFMPRLLGRRLPRGGPSRRRRWPNWLTSGRSRENDHFFNCTNKCQCQKKQQKCSSLRVPAQSSFYWLPFTLLPLPSSLLFYYEAPMTSLVLSLIKKEDPSFAFAVDVSAKSPSSAKRKKFLQCDKMKRHRGQRLDHPDHVVDYGGHF